MIRNLTIVALAVMSMSVTVLAANRRTTLPHLQLGAEWSEKRFDSTPTRYIELDENGSKVIMAARRRLGVRLVGTNGDRAFREGGALLAVEGDP